MDTFTSQQSDESAQPDEPEAAASIPMPPFPGAVRFNPKVKSGTVVIWQNALKARGYTHLKVDGYFGKVTNDCVVDWQTARPQARNVDGICALNMWRDLTTNPKPRYYADEELDPAESASEYLQEGPIPEYLPESDTEQDPDAEIEDV